MKRLFFILTCSALSFNAYSSDDPEKPDGHEQEPRRVSQLIAKLQRESTSGSSSSSSSGEPSPSISGSPISRGMERNPAKFKESQKLIAQQLILASQDSPAPSPEEQKRKKRASSAPHEAPKVSSPTSSTSEPSPFISQGASLGELQTSAPKDIAEDMYGVAKWQDLVDTTLPFGLKLLIIEQREEAVGKEETLKKFMAAGQDSSSIDHDISVDIATIRRLKGQLKPIA